MSARLQHIQNWAELAQKANWSSVALAKACDVSFSTLKRHFKKNKGNTPKVWVMQMRQQQAIKLLLKKMPVKAVASELGYRHASSFSREFKKHWGKTPENFRQIVNLIKFDTK